MADSVKETTNQSCPNCGCKRKDWPEPNGYDGMHCCEACAHGQPCSCGCEDQTGQSNEAEE